MWPFFKRLAPGQRVSARNENAKARALEALTRGLAAGRVQQIRTSCGDLLSEQDAAPAFKARLTGQPDKTLSRYAFESVVRDSTAGYVADGEWAGDGTAAGFYAAEENGGLAAQVGGVYPAWLADDGLSVVFVAPGSGGTPQTLPASTADGAGLNYPPGVAPDDPDEGDVWLTTAGYFFFVGGAAYQFVTLDYLQAHYTPSPLTTPGDVWAFSTEDTRQPVGTDGQVLTADSTRATGLRWATPTASPLTTAKLAADFTTVSSTFVDVTGLGFAVAANTDYAFEFVFVTTNTGTPSAALNGPAGATWLAFVSNPSPVTQVTAYDTGVTLTSSATRVVTKLSGVLRNGATAGTVVLRVKVATGTITVYQGSGVSYY